MSPILKKALYFAAQKHDGQYRKGGRVPYFAHPVQVAFGVSMYTNDEEILAAAFLHDVLEDCPGVSIRLLRKEFGNRIAQIVSEMTLVRGNKRTTWQQKKKTYLKKIKVASKDTLIIVAVDKMINLQAYFDALESRGQEMAHYFSGTPDGYQWYYTEIAKILTSKLGKHPATKDYIAKWRLYKKENL